MRALKMVALSLSLLVAGCERSRSPHLGDVASTTATHGDEAGGESAEQAPAPASCRPTDTVLRPVGPSQSGAVVLARTADRDLAIIADSDEGAVIAVDANRGLEVSRLALDSAVEHVLVAPDGRIVASLADRDRVAVLGWEGDGESEGLVARCSRPVAGEPSGMAMSDERLLVASRWSAEVHELDAETLTLRRTIPVGRDPYAVAFRRDGEAVVSHVVGGRVSRIQLADGAVEALDASRVDHKGGGTPLGLPMPKRPGKKSLMMTSFASTPTVRAHREATQAYAIAVAADGRAYLPASLADGSESPHAATGYGGGAGGIRTHSGVTLVVNDHRVEVPSGTARAITTDCQLPRGAAWDEQEGLLYVGCRGVDAVHIYDQKAAKHGDVLFGRIVVPSGPTGLAIDLEKRRLVVWSQFSGRLAAIDLPTRKSALQTGTVVIDQPRWTADEVEIERHRPLPAAVRHGRELFHEAGPMRRIAFDGRACASCHPEGRDDAITWTTVEGPRQTPILMARLEGTAPFGWNGEKPDVQAHLDRTLARLAGTGLSREQRADILAYLGAMRSPRAAISEDERLVARGAELYADDDVGCATCHPTGAGTSDGLTHELKPRNTKDLVGEFDTPSLRFVAQSPPYFHDGRYDTLDALLADAESTMGHSSSLPAEDRRALKAFLQTL